jgi:hypothetical protein
MSTHAVDTVRGAGASLTARTASHPGRPRRLLAKLLLALVSLAVAGVAGELMVRAVLKQDTVLFPRYHTDYHYGEYTLRGIRPHSVFWHTSGDGSWRFVTNNRGLRDVRDFDYQKPPGALRVLALGDSHTQGYEVRQEATFSAVLERYLQAHRLKTQVLNAGVSGFSTAEELAYLTSEGYRYQPDVVVLGFYANDFDDNLKAGLFALDDTGRLVPKSYTHIPGVRIQNIIYALPGVRWLSENSYLYSLAFNGAWEFFKAKLRQDAQFEMAVGSAMGRSKSEVDLAVALIESVSRFCVDHGIRLIVVDIPSATDNPYHFDSSVPDTMREQLAAAHIELLDSRVLLANFEDATELHRLHGHAHISELTHALIGVELGKRIAPHPNGQGAPKPGP